MLKGKKLGKTIKISIILMVSLYLLACLALWHYQTKLIFFPDSTVNNTPANLGLNYEEIFIPTPPKKINPDTNPNTASQTGNLHSWWIPAQTTNNSNQTPPTVLYLHGNSSNVGDLIGRAELFHQWGCNVLLFDYRGYGLSSGPFPNEQRVYEDAEAVWQYLTQAREIPENNIIIYGGSLGGAIAINLTSHHPTTAGSIIEASFTSMKDMVKYQYSFFPFPTRLLLTNRFNSLQKVRSLTTPLLFIHGSADQVIPVHMSHQLHTAAINTTSKELLIIESGDHNDLPITGGDRYACNIKAFIAPPSLKQANIGHYCDKTK